MRMFKPTLLAAAVAACCAAGTASAQFSGAFTFGDSLLDGGQFGYRFTTNPGLTAPEYAGLHWNLTTTPSFQGGTNYAEGGAMVNTKQGTLPPGVPDLSVMDQVNAAIAKGALNPNAFINLDGGGNDIRRQFALFATGQITQAQMQANVAQAALDLAAAAAKLQAAGANYIVLQHVPDIGKVPDVTRLGPAASAGFTALSQLFNLTLNQAVGQLGLRVIPFDAYRFMTEVFANPGAYGLVNVTSPACNTPTGANCQPANLVAPNANMSHFFADGLHGTTGAYLIEAQAMESLITGPQQMGALAEAPLAVEQAAWRTLDGRMQSAANSNRATTKLEAWAAYDYSAPDYSSGYMTGNGDVNTVAVGLDMKVSPKMLAGVMFNYSTNNASMGDANFKLREPMMTMYAGYGEGPWYFGGTLGAGGLDYSTTRNIALGATTRTESGTTRGWHFVGRLIGGYWFNAGDWVHGPTLKFTYQEARVRQFSENGSSSTALTYGQQERTSFITSAGWQAVGQLGAIRPFARATWEYEGQADARTITASVNGINGSYSVPAFKPDDSWGNFSLGASTDFGKVTGYVSGSATAGKGDGDSWAITVGLRVPM